MERELEHVHDLGLHPIELNTKLPTALLESLIQTWSFLELIELNLIQQLKAAWSSSPDMRAHFGPDCGNGDEAIVLDIQAKKTSHRKRDKELEHILTLFEYLWKPGARTKLKVHILVDALSHVLRTNKRANALTSPWIASLLSKLSVVSECLRQLNHFQPWAKEVAHTVKLRQTELLMAHCSTFARWHAVLHADFQVKELIELGKPRSQFRYPVKKRRTRANVEAMQAAEAALDAFWQVADARFVECTGSTPHDLTKDLMRERTLQRTSPWEEPARAQPANPLNQQVEYIYVPFSNAFHDPAQQVTGAFDKLSVSARAKTKTQGLVCTHNGLEDGRVHEEKCDLQPTFTVDKRAHRVFRNLSTHRSRTITLAMLPGGTSCMLWSLLISPHKSFKVLLGSLLQRTWISNDPYSSMSLTLHISCLSLGLVALDDVLLGHTVGEVTCSVSLNKLNNLYSVYILGVFFPNALPY